MNKIWMLLLISLLASCSSDQSEPDTDGDGIVDKVDAFPFDETESLDTDKDTIGDNSDNCVDIENVNQVNSDEDLLGDACDPDDDNDNVADLVDAFPYDSNFHSDHDGDGIANAVDNCFLLSNPDQLDTNEDGIGNACSLNDTGAFTASDGLNAYMASCETNANGSNVINQQDCNIGRDAESRSTGLNKVGGGLLGFDFTKINANGEALPIQDKRWIWSTGSEEDSTNWSCILDNVTGLLWERKDIAGLSRAQDVYMPMSVEAYLEFNPRSDTIKNCHGYDENNPDSVCTTPAFIKRVNNNRLCNKENWRLPTAKELASILAVDPYLSEEEYRYYGMVDRDYFYVGNDQGIAYQTAENISYLYPAGFFNNTSQ